MIIKMVWKKLLRTVPKTDTGELVIHTEVVEKNNIKGTLQTNSVTLGEGKPVLKKNNNGVIKTKEATV